MVPDQEVKFLGKQWWSGSQYLSIQRTSPYLPGLLNDLFFKDRYKVLPWQSYYVLIEICTKGDSPKLFFLYDTLGPCIHIHVSSVNFWERDNSTVFSYVILNLSDLTYSLPNKKRNEKDNKIAKLNNDMLVPIKICERAYTHFMHVTFVFVFATHWPLFCFFKRWKINWNVQNKWTCIVTTKHPQYNVYVPYNVGGYINDACPHATSADNQLTGH